jgi:hypothetical protein
MTHVNWTKQASLAAVLLVLGTTAYWLEYKHKPEKEGLEEQNKKIFSLKDLQVQDLILLDSSGHPLEVRCSDATSKLCKPGDNSKWEIAQPLRLKADDSNVNALVSALNNLTVSETIDLKDETSEKRAALLKEYGLDAASLALPASKKIEVTTPKGTTVLHLGYNHPIGDSIFGLIETSNAGQKPTGKVDDTKVYLVPTYFKANFDHDLTYWRDKKLMTASAHEIESFKLTAAPKTNFSGERKDGQWTLKTAKGEELPGDIENIDNLLTAATFLTAKTFVTDNKSDVTAKAALKGTRPALTLTLQQEKGSNKEAPAPMILTLFQKPQAGAHKAAERLFATVSNLDPLFELESTSLPRLDKEIKDLRLTKLVTSMERFTAKRLEFSGKPLGKTSLVMTSKDGRWSIEGDKAEPSNAKIQALMDKLSGNRIQEFLTSAPAGESEGITVQLGDEKSNDTRKIVFWKNADKLYARDMHGKRKESFRVDPAIQSDLPWTRDFFTKTEAPAAQTAAAPPGTPNHGGMPAGFPGAPPEPGKPLIPVPNQNSNQNPKR